LSAVLSHGEKIGSAVHPISSDSNVTSDNVEQTGREREAGLGATEDSPGTPPRGHRARPLSDVDRVLDTLAGRVAGTSDLAAALPGGGTAWIVPAREHHWQEALDSVLLTALNPVARHRPARGILPEAVDVTKVVTDLVHVLTSAVSIAGARRSTRSGRVPLLTERELSTLWLARLLGALCERGWSNRARIPTLPVALSQARDGDVVLLSDVTATAVLWIPRRRVLVWRQVSALAHWMLISAEGNVLGAGVETDG
jgi:hypothetical protein